MNKNNLWKKVMVFAIILLFVGVSVIPSISGDFKIKNKEIDENNSPMPTYIGPGVDNWEIVEIVGSWNFDENSGYVAYDGSSYENDGSCVRTQWTDGYSGSGLSFIGTDNSAVMIDDDPSLGFDDLGENEGFMIDFWMQNHQTNFIQSYVGLISKQYKGGYMVGFGSDHKLGFNIISPNAEIVQSVRSNTDIDDNNWHHIVAVWSGNTLYIYVDDMGTPDNLNYVGDFEIGDTYKWLDFGNDWPTDSLNPFDGKMDEVKISIIKEAGENTPPRASFEWSPIKPEIDEEITFDALNSFDPDGIITLYEWDWDNDGIFDESYENPTAKYSWSSSGGYIVTLRVTDNGGLTSTKKSTINVAKNIAPTVEIINPSFGEGVIGLVSIEGFANDYDGSIEHVEVKISRSQNINVGTWVPAIGTNDWTYSLNSTIYTNGTWIIASRSADNEGEYSDIDFIALTFGYSGNICPKMPEKPVGPLEGKIKREYHYETNTSDSEGNHIYFQWDWGDDDSEYIMGPYSNFENCTASHTWKEAKDYAVSVRAIDDPNGDGKLCIHGYCEDGGCESEWSTLNGVNISTKYKSFSFFDNFEIFEIMKFFICIKCIKEISCNII